MFDFDLKEPIAILGFGTEGKAALNYIKKLRIENVTVLDQNPNTKVPDSIKTILGEEAFDDLSEFNTIIRSPGVQFKLAGIQEAIDSGSKVTSLTKMTLEAAADRITAVTGSNGKTTTTTLAGEILKAHYGDRLIIGGNDREPILQEALNREDDPILIEASSFQFMDADKSPYIAALLNITPNHLDWHDTVEEYTEAKGNILRYQNLDDWAVLNANDENVKKLGETTSTQKFWIGQKIGDHWCVWEKGHLVMSYDKQEAVVIHKDDLRVKTHPDNILFAVAIAILHIVPLSTIKEQLKLFNGAEHRLEHVRTVKDIHFYNDSASTAPESTEVAIEQFPHNKLILLLGGSSKNVDFSMLAQRIANQDVRVYLFGEEGKRIKEALESVGGEGNILEYNTSGDFEAIIKDVYQLADTEDNVVLSPACASFDMFKNSKERGKLFKEIVNKL